MLPLQGCQPGTPQFPSWYPGIKKVELLGNLARQKTLSIFVLALGLPWTLIPEDFVS